MERNGTHRPRLPRAEREQQTLEIAHDLFATKGFRAVTMDEVAAAVGVTKPLLYNYFGNKERLFIACMERAGEALLATVRDAVSNSENPAEDLATGLRAFFAFVDEDRAAWAVLFDPTLPNAGVVAERMAEFRQRLVDLVIAANLNRFGPEQRDRVRVEVEALSTAILGASEALARWWLRDGNAAIPAAEAAELLISTVEPGLRHRSGRAAAPHQGDPTQ